MVRTNLRHQSAVHLQCFKKNKNKKEEEEGTKSGPCHSKGMFNDRMCTGMISIEAPDSHKFYRLSIWMLEAWVTTMEEGSLPIQWAVPEYSKKRP